MRDLAHGNLAGAAKHHQRAEHLHHRADVVGMRHGLPPSRPVVVVSPGPPSSGVSLGTMALLGVGALGLGAALSSTSQPKSPPMGTYPTNGVTYTNVSSTTPTYYTSTAPTTTTTTVYTPTAPPPMYTTSPSYTTTPTYSPQQPTYSPSSPSYFPTQSTFSPQGPPTGYVQPTSPPLTQQQPVTLRCKCGNVFLAAPGTPPGLTFQCPKCQSVVYS